MFWWIRFQRLLLCSSLIMVRMVSILVLVDQVPEAVAREGFRISGQSFNPCSGGSGSRGQGCLGLDASHRSFNPCSGGSGSRGCLSGLAIGEPGMFQSLFWWIRFQRLMMLCVTVFSVIVSILVLVDQVPEAEIPLKTGKLYCVSILVLVDQVPEDEGEDLETHIRKKFQSLFWWIRFQRFLFRKSIFQIQYVSILVLVDQVPEDIRLPPHMLLMFRVSILVLVDQVPEVRSHGHTVTKSVVSILVLVDQVPEEFKAVILAAGFVVFQSLFWWIRFQRHRWDR